MRKAGPGFSEAALKENTDLKVDKVTMQKELHRYRKTLGAAERDLESYRQQVIEAQERAKRKHVDEEQREELQRLKQALADSEAETQRLREELDSTGGRNGDVSRMRNEMGDVEAELREKERIIEEQEDEIVSQYPLHSLSVTSDHIQDGLKEKVTRGTSSSTDLEEELATMQDRVQELEEKKSGSKEALEEAQTDLAESRDLVKALEARVTRLHTHTKDVEQKVQDAEERAEEAEKSARILREEGQAEALSAAQADLDEAREDVRSLKETVEDLRSELDDQRREKEGIEDRMEEMENAPSSEGEERARALEDSRTELAECRRAIKALEDGVDRLQTEVDAANQRRRQAEEKAQDLENENQSEALKNAHDNLIETRQTVKTLEARAGDLQAQLEEANGQIQELEAAMDRAEGRDDKLKDALNDANDELAARRNEINDLEDALDGLKAQLDEARTARSEATESKFMAEAIATAKDQSLRDTQDEVKKYRRQIQELETERDHIRSERRVTDDSWREKELEKSIERLKLEVKNANEKMQGARQERSQAQISLAESQTKVRLLEADLDRTRSEIWHTNQKAKEWEEKAQGLEDEVIFLQGNLDEEGHHAKQEVATARLELAHETERARMEEKRSEIEISGLQAELSVAREGKERELVSAKRNVQRLELRVKELEGQQSSHVVDQGQSMAAERKELHGKLREAKIELEELREQMVEPEQKLADVLHREQELRTQLKRAREDRAGQAQRVNTKAFELDSLQRRYDRTVGKHARLQQGWEDERKAMMQRVRFANTSVSSIRHDDPAEVAQLEHQVVEKEKRHQSEIRGLAKQIMYLRKKCEREEGFRADLAFSKQYFLLQIEMYDTWYVGPLLVWLQSTSSDADLMTATTRTCRCLHRWASRLIGRSVRGGRACELWLSW